MTILEQTERVYYVPARYVYKGSKRGTWLHLSEVWTDEDIEYVRNRVEDLKKSTELDDFFIVKITKTETVERLDD